MAGIAIDSNEQSGVGIRQRSSRSGVTNPGTASHVLWGNIIGTLADQADLQAVLDELRILAYAGL